MSAEADRLRYAGYRVVLRESKRKCAVAESIETGEPILVFATAYRIDAERLFEVYLRVDADASMRADGVRWAANLPSGGWILRRKGWWRTRRRGHSARYQSIGRPIDDPLIELEIEMSGDVDFDLELQHLIAERTV